MNSTVCGVIRKLVAVAGSPIEYQLPLSQSLINLNTYLGREISIRHTGAIHCIHCDRLTKKSFQQGYCYPCTQRLACCDLCILKPELCHFHKNTCREPEWGLQHCLQPHIVYLANTSGLKVGITRQTQIPTRWIDQGARQALPLYKVASRLLSGQLEVIIKKHVADRTQWRAILQSEGEQIDMPQAARELLEKCRDEIAKIRDAETDAIAEISDAEPIHLTYPVLQWATKPKSINLAKMPIVRGILQGIVGQYLVTDIGVINMRSHGGYHVEFSAT